MRPALLTAFLCAGGCTQSNDMTHAPKAEPSGPVYARDAHADVAFEESPRFEREYERDVFSRTLDVIGQQSGVHAHAGLWTSVLNFSSEKSSGTLYYTLAHPWVLAEVTDPQVKWTRSGVNMECGPRVEAMRIASDALRSSTERLQLLVVHSAAILPDGRVVVHQSIVPEFEFHATSIGHARYTNAEGREVESGALIVRGGGFEISVRAGGRDSFMYDEDRYIVAPALVEIGDGGLCGRTSFHLYREGVIKRAEISP